MSSVKQKTSATEALLAAALTGFLSVAAACGGMGASSSKDSSSQAGSNAADSDDSAARSDGASGGVSGDSGVEVTSSLDTPANPHTPIPATKCESGQVPNPKVTATAIGALTQDAFAALCAARNGIFEIQPLCGGSNSCRGMSYDSETQALTEHSCQATNTCAGYSCVVCA